MRQIENNFDKSEHSKDIIAGTKVSWGAFATVINDMVIDINVDMASSEDKRLGTYFARKKELEAGRFSEKVLKYLWDDAFVAFLKAFSHKRSFSIPLPVYLMLQSHM